MRPARLLLLVFFFTISVVTGSLAQKKDKTTKPVKKTVAHKPVSKPPSKSETKPKTTVPSLAVTADSTEHEQKVKDIVAFLQYMLNMLGSEETSSRDKDVIVTESYSKIFKDQNVQVEDDLDENREVATNKNVVAYLKDVDFFFSDVKFEFTIDNIHRGENVNNKLFYIVTLKRNLTGTTADGKKVNNTISRFIEVNYNPEDQDLKIASIYTHEFDEQEALVNWWKQLTPEWKNIFKNKLTALTPGRAVPDSLAIGDIKDVTGIESLDISKDPLVQSIEPLSQLTRLKMLHLSGTGITDLSPIRNLTELTDLDVSHTGISDMTTLKYALKLTRLNISRTEILDLSVIQRMQNLLFLDASRCKASDFSSITGLTVLTELDLSGTRIQNLTALKGLSQLTSLYLASTPVADLTGAEGLEHLKSLDIDSSRVTNLAPLAGLGNLEVLTCNLTGVFDLTSLKKLSSLKKIYCDKTKINRATAEAFGILRPAVLVIFDSEDMRTWWDALRGDWPDVVSKVAKIGIKPSKEELAKVIGIDSINVAGKDIADLTPLGKLLKLRVLIANNTAITDLSPLRDLHELVYLDIHETEISGIFVLGKLDRLRLINADKTGIQTIEPLFGLRSLQRLYVDQTAIHDITAVEFLEKNPQCLLIYKTIHLNRWWNKLPGEWRQVLKDQMHTDSASREDMHKLVEQEALHFKDQPVKDLSALGQFIRLRELHFSGTAVTDLTPLAGFGSLRSLHASHGPLQQIEVLGQLPELEDLDISDTPIDELKVLTPLGKLKQLNCSGTQIKRLDPIKQLVNLESLDCSNTKVGNLDPVSHQLLKVLKCYNTKVSTREIENFKKANPACNVVYYR